MKLKVAEHRQGQLSVNAPIMFFACDRELAEDAFAGDVIGIPNHGVLRVGDSLSETGTLRFAGLPNFAPEILQRVRVKDPLKAKHLKKALEGLAEEGVTQLFRPMIGARTSSSAPWASCSSRSWPTAWPTNTSSTCIFEAAPYAEARWLAGDKRRPRGLHRASTARPWPPTSTNSRCSWPSRPGRSATSPSAIPRCASSGRRSGLGRDARNAGIEPAALATVVLIGAGSALAETPAPSTRRSCRWRPPVATIPTGPNAWRYPAGLASAASRARTRRWPTAWSSGKNLAAYGFGQAVTMLATKLKVRPDVLPTVVGKPAYFKVVFQVSIGVAWTAIR